MRPFYPESEMTRMLQEAKRLGMRFPKGSESIPISVWCEVANGIGPGAWSRTVRKISTTLQPFAVIAAMLHDMAYCCPVKDREHFNKANDDFHFNIDIAPDVDASSVRIPSMFILSPPKASISTLRAYTCRTAPA